MLTYIILLNVVLEILTTNIRREKVTKGIQIGKEVAKVLPDDIIYNKNPEY